jgi:hypothetical protein
MGDPAMDRGEILGFLARAEVLVAQSDKLLSKREQLAEILYRCDLDTTAASELLGSVEQTLSELLAHRSHLVQELAQLDYADWLDSVSAYTSADDALGRRVS